MADLGLYSYGCRGYQYAGVAPGTWEDGHRALTCRAHAYRHVHAHAYGHVCRHAHDRVCRPV